jgi:hypothetical protein
VLAWLAFYLTIHLNVNDEMYSLLRRGFSVGMNVDTSYHFARKLMAQAFLFGSLPTPILQGQGGASLCYFMGVKRHS